MGEDRETISFEVPNGEHTRVPRLDGQRQTHQ